MKFAKLSIFALAMGLFVASCGNSETKTESTPVDTAAAAPVTAPVDTTAAAATTVDTAAKMAPAADTAAKTAAPAEKH